MMVQGIISLLDPESDAFVRGIWSSLEDNFGLAGSHQTFSPHFSWHVAESYSYDRLKAELTSLGKKNNPFCIHTTGLGIFLAPAPVLYLPIVVTGELITLHNQIVELADPICTDPNPCYATISWMPHITLAYLDPDVLRMGVVLDHLKGMDFTRTIPINNFAIFCPSPTGETEMCRIEFGKSEMMDGT